MEIKGTNVIAPVVPFSTDDVHPSHEARYGKGGYRTVATVQERDAIPAPRRETGMLVHVVAEAKAYQLGADLTTWAEFVTGSNPAIGDVTGLEDALDGKLALAGGAMSDSAVVTYSSGTTDSEIGGWGFGVELTGGSGEWATVEYNAVTVQDGSGVTQLTPGHLNLPNGTQVMVGSFDNSTGGANGISLVCAVGYEWNWQGGRVRSVVVGGDGTPVPIYFDSAISVPAAGITFADNSTQTTAWTGSITVSEIADFPPIPEWDGNGYQFPQLTVSATISTSIGASGIHVGPNPGGITIDDTAVTFPDDSVQTTAWTGSFSYDDLDDLPTLFDGAYSSLTGLPALGTAAAASTGDFAAASHTHALSSLTQSSAATGQVVAWDGSAWAPATPATYSLPTASGSTLGGVKVGSGVNIDGSGVISVSTNYAAASHTHTASAISDSTTAGRALLTAADAAAQRTSLGLGTLATQSGTFSGTSSGTNTGDQSLASATEARQMTDATKIVTVLRGCEQHEARITIDANQFSSATANGGSVSSGATQQLYTLLSGTTANGTVVARIGTAQNLPWSVRSLASPVQYNGILFSTPKRLSVRFFRLASSTNGIFRYQFGGKDVNSTSAGQLSNRGFGFEIRNLRVWLIAHNGTSLSQVDSGTDLATTGGPYSYEAVLTSDGAGNVALSLNGSQIATSSGGPSTDLTGTATPWGLTAEVMNGGDTSHNTWYIWRPMILSGTF